MVVLMLVPMHAPMTVRVLAPAVALLRVLMHVFLAVLEIVFMSLPGHVPQLCSCLSVVVAVQMPW